MSIASRPRLAIGVLLFVCVAILAVRDGGQALTFLDTRYFLHVSERFFSSDWRHVYADPQLQVGPLHLVIYGVLAVLSELLGAQVETVLSVAIQTGYCAGLVLVARVLLGRSKPGWLDASLVLAAVALAMSWRAFATGHFMEGAIPLLWMMAAADLKKAAFLRSGIWLILASSLKMWGVLGAAMFLLVPNPRKALLGSVILASGLAIVYGPFVLFGRFEMLSFSWRVLDPGPLTSWYFQPGDTVGWLARGLQALCVVSVGLGCAYWWRKNDSPHVAWSIVLIMTVLKVCVDPVAQDYHWLAVQTSALMGVRLLLETPRDPKSLVSLTGLYVVIAWPSLIGGLAASAAAVLACAGVGPRPLQDGEVVVREAAVK